MFPALIEFRLQPGDDWVVQKYEKYDSGHKGQGDIQQEDNTESELAANLNWFQKRLTGKLHLC